MSKITYDDFVRQQTTKIRLGLDFLAINEKKGKSYNDFLIKFLEGSTLTVTNKCNFDDKKKNDVLIDILSDIPIIDSDMFDTLIKRREEYIITKPLGGSNNDYEIRTENIKKKIKKPIKFFVQERTKTYFNFYSHNFEEKIKIIIGQLKKLDYVIEEYKIQISTNETGNVEYENMLSVEEISELKNGLGELEEERNNLNMNLIEYEERYQSRVNNYPSKVIAFEKKLQTITEKYIFAHTNPLGRLKKSYIELFLLDKMNIVFLQSSEYDFSLGDKALSLIEDKKKLLLDVIQTQEKYKQGELNFDE